MTENNRSAPSKSGDGKRRHDRIGDQLRKLYDDVASEPVPDDFLSLLEDADKSAEAGDEEDKA